MADWGQYTKKQVMKTLRPHKGVCPRCGGRRSKLTFVGVCGKCLKKQLRKQRRI